MGCACVGAGGYWEFGVGVAWVEVDLVGDGGVVESTIAGSQGGSNLSRFEIGR